MTRDIETDDQYTFEDDPTTVARELCGAAVPTDTAGVVMARVTIEMPDGQELSLHRFSDEHIEGLLLGGRVMWHFDGDTDQFEEMLMALNGEVRNEDADERSTMTTMEDYR